MKTLKGINTFGFFVMAVLAFFPLVTINIWDEPVTKMNIIAFSFGPSDVSDWKTYMSSVIKSTNLLVIAIPIFGCIASSVSDIENGFNKSMIICIAAALIDKRILNNIIKSTDRIPYAFAFSTTKEIWFDVLIIVANGVLILSIILLAYSAYNVFQGFMKNTNTPLIKNVCRHCGTVNENGAGFCIKCGKKLDSDIRVTHFKTCPSCGQENKGDAVFCINCGNKLD